MNKIKNMLIVVISALTVLAIGAGTYSALAAPAEVANVGQGNGYGAGTGISLFSVPASDLDTQEAAALLYMREEEKLARDVYNVLYKTWGLPAFANIASSEQKHMDAIKLLLDRYGLTDPALAPGSFTDPDLQALYNQLVAQGSVSLPDALKVGVSIEETDIADLQERLAQTDNADLQQVFNNLMRGSYNHLNAFTRVSQNGTGSTNGGQGPGQGRGGYRGGNH